MSAWMLAWMFSRLSCVDIWLRNIKNTIVDMHEVYGNYVLILTSVDVKTGYKKLMCVFAF